MRDDIRDVVIQIDQKEVIAGVTPNSCPLPMAPPGLDSLPGTSGTVWTSLFVDTLTLKAQDSASSEQTTLLPDPAEAAIGAQHHLTLPALSLSSPR